MKINALGARLTAAGLALISGVVLAQLQIADLGKQEFDKNCASCHGEDGTGNGPMLVPLRRSPADLTQLAKANQGILPVARLYEVIEGGNVFSHGTRNMPVWGRAFRVQDAAYYVDAPYDAETNVRAHVLVLLEYINRIQIR